MDSGVRAFPAPWNLQGTGYIFLYRFSEKFAEENGRVPDFLQGSFAGGFGSVMLVNYASSEAGPYGELLFIPGKFRFQGKKLDTISKIYVSTMESVVNGRANWGIPKEKADFAFTKIGENTEKAAVTVGGTPAAEFTLRSGKLAFPVNTKLMPFPLVQKHEDNYFFTNFSGKGKGHFAKIEELRINPALFPDVSALRPLAVIRVDPFDITFPVAEVKKA